MSAGALAVKDVTLRFGGVTAVDHVNFEVSPGTVFAVIGPNGAGKTSLFNVVSGFYDPTSGVVSLDGRELKHALRPQKYLFAVLFGVVAFMMSLVFFDIERIWEEVITANYIYQESFGTRVALQCFFKIFVENLCSGSGVLSAFIGVTFAAGYLVQSYRSARSPEEIADAGIARTFQNIRLFSNLTAAENVVLGMDEHLRSTFFDGCFWTKRLRREHREVDAAADELLRFVGLEGEGERRAGSLPYGHQRRLEIARALATRPKVLLLDEPAAGMNPVEGEDLVQLIGRIRDRGITVLLIEHHMKVVMGISERIVVLDYGKKIAEGTPEEIRSNQKVIAAYLGKEAEQ
jgi:ABC-type branched-subunit amino acid transport system ATPase component